MQTYSGLFCVVLNPWTSVPGLYGPAMIELYRNARLNCSSMPPHVYAVAQSAYEGMQTTDERPNQAVLIT